MFLVFALVAVLALYQFGNKAPSVDYLKQQLSLRNSKQDYSTQEVLKANPPASQPRPPVVDPGIADHVGKGDAAATSKLTPPPVEEPVKPVQKAPPPTKSTPPKVGAGGAAAKPADKETLKPDNHAATKDSDGRVRVLPNPVPADSYEKIRPLIEQGEGRLDEDVLPPDAEPVFWVQPEEHFPLEEKDVIHLPTGTPKKLPKIQAEFEEETKEQKKDRLAKQNVIKEAFLHSWNGYKEKAWGHDEVRPVSGKWKDPFNGWGATLVDTLDLLWMMDLKDEFEEAVEQVGKINFKTSRRADIPLFETTIRYLGGLVGAYDVSGGKYRVLLDKAVELAEILIGAFDTPNRMPDTFYQWKPSFASQPHRASTRVVLAELGSLAVEFTRLAQLTKEPRYYDAIARITDALEEWQGRTRIPGMWPSFVDASGCKKPIVSGPSVEQITSANILTTLDEGGSPISKSKEKGQELSPKKGTTANRDEDELEGTDITKGRIPGWDDIHDKEESSSQDSKSKLPVPKKKVGEDDVEFVPLKKPDPLVFEVKQGSKDAAKKEPTAQEAKPKLPPPKKQGSDDIEYVPLQRPDPLVFDVKEGTKAKRQLNNLDAKVAAEESPTRGLSSNIGKAKDNVPAQLPSHKHDKIPTSLVDLIEEAPCEPQGLESQSEWGTDDFTLGSLADSTYEYLPKMYLMLNGLVPQYRSMYEKAIDAAKEKLLFRPMIPDEKREILISGSSSVSRNYGSTGDSKSVKQKETHRPSGSHLTCFTGGMFALGGKLFGREDDVEISKKLTDGCVYAYEMTATGIMPETFLATACDDRKHCPWNETKWWLELDPDQGEWREKNYASSMKYYYAQLEARESAIANAEKKAKAALAKVAAPDEDEDDFVSPPKPESLRSHSDMQKRQLKDEDLDSASTASNKDDARHVQAADDAEDKYEAMQIAKQNEILNPTPTTDESAWIAPSTTSDDEEPYWPIYSPEKPPSHEEFVTDMIREDKLPPGIHSMGDRRYILR